MKLFTLLVSILCLVGCASNRHAAPEVIEAPRVKLPALNLEDTVPDHYIKDLLVEHHFPAGAIQSTRKRYTVLTQDWLKVYGDQFHQALLLTGETNDLVRMASICADFAFRQQYPKKVIRFGDQFRTYPFYGVAFGEVYCQDLQFNFYVTRTPAGALELHLWNPRSNRPVFPRLGQPEQAYNVRF